MGQTCCRIANQGARFSGEESWRRAGSAPTIGTLNDLPTRNRSLGDIDDEFWDARSIGSMSVYSTTSQLSSLSIDDLLDQYQEDLHGDIHDLDEEIEEAALTGGHLVPKEIEDAAAKGTMTPLPTDGAGAVLVDIKQPTTALIHVTPLLDSAVTVPLPETPLPDFFSSETALLQLQQAKELISTRRILEAHETLIHLCDLCNNIDKPSEHSTLCSLHSLKPHSTVLGIDIAALETDVHAVHAALTGLEDDSGWMVSRKGDLRVLYSHKKGTTEHSLKFHATFPHPVQHILSLAHEWDLLPTWNKFTLEAIKLAEPSIFENIVYGAQWMMKPFRHMQAIVKARGFDLAASAQHRCLLIMIEDLNNTDLQDLDVENTYPHLPEAMAKRKTVNILKTSCIKLRPLLPKIEETPAAAGKNLASGGDGNKHSTNSSTSTPPPVCTIAPRTDAHLMVHLDPHIPYVPSSLVNFVLGILAPYIYNQMLKVLDDAFKQEEGQFPQRIREQPELYGLVEQRMAEFADEL